MFCTNCGKQLPDGSAFCPDCGAVLDDRAAETAAPAAPVAAPSVAAAPAVVESRPAAESPSAPAASPAKKNKAMRGGFAAAGVLAFNALLVQLASCVSRYYDPSGNLGKTVLETSWALIKAQYPVFLILIAATVFFFLPLKRVAFLTAIPRALALALAAYLFFGKANPVLGGSNPLFMLTKGEDTASLLLTIAFVVNVACCALYLLGTLLPKTGTTVPVLHLILSLGWIGLIGTASAFNVINNYKFDFYPSLVEILTFFSALFFILAHVSPLFTLRSATKNR